MENFRELGIDESVIKVIKEQNFSEPTEIQQKSIPHILEGRDVLGCSATGSGKTLAFGSGIIQNCEKGRGVQSLVLVPTRELCEQVYKNLSNFSKYKNLSVTPVYGGVGIGPQIQAIPRTEIVVGTPGRILDHLDRKTINLSNVKILVIDEADQMFDMGFIQDVEKIIRYCPRNRQTLLFSATLNSDVSRLASKHMRNPVSVSAVQNVDPSKLAQCYYDVDDSTKFSLLVHLLKQEHEGVVMIFCNSRRAVDFVNKNLRANGIEATAIHGGFSQHKRNNAIEKFHAGKIFVLVCTDVAARGLDIKGVSHVYNYDIPKDSKQYIHRIGRTARAGEEGKAISILGQRDHDSFRRVLRENPVKIHREELPQFEKVVIRVEPKTQGFRGNRFGQKSGFRNQNRRGVQQRDWLGNPRRHHHGYERR